jgi:2,3-bisphosphoglycerate-independent phosphoglycerate mutase
MVGHSGDFTATVKAIECLDKQLGKLYNTIVKKHHGTLYITGDHGKAEEMFDEKTGQPKTAHTTNPVYFLMLQKGLEHKKLSNSLRGLSNKAPFILKNMNIKSVDTI